MFFIQKNFFKKIPSDKIFEIKKDLEKFSKEFKENNLLFQKMGKGWWVDKIESSENRYEFRVNQGDRIIFFRDKENIFYLCWGTHDNALNEGKNIEIKFDDFEDFIYEKEEEIFPLDKIFDEKSFYENIKFDYSNEQLDLINIKGKAPFLAIGAPGSGKTKIINEIIRHMRNEYKILLISKSKIDGLQNEKVKILKFEEIIPVHKDLVDFEIFQLWFDSINKGKTLKYSSLDMWKLIVNGFYLEKNQEHIEKYDFIIRKYRNWLDTENKMDINDYIKLGIKISEENKITKYDFIICDDFQEIPILGLELIKKLLKNPSHFIGFTDEISGISGVKRDLGKLKELSYESNFKNFYLTKNYRSSSKIINFLETITQNKIYQIIGDHTEDQDISIGNAVSFYEADKIDSILNNIGNSNIIVVFDENEKNKYCKNSDKFYTLKTIYNRESENIICLDILSKISNFKTEEFGWEEYLNFLIFIVKKAKKNIIFLEKEESKIELIENLKIPKLAIEALEKILNNPNIEEDLLEAEECKKDQNYKKAIYIYNQYGMLEEAEICCGEQYILEKQYEKAIEIFEKYKITEKIKICESLIKLSHERKIFLETLDLEKYFSEIQVNNDYGKYELSKIYQELGRYKDSFSVIEEILTKNLEVDLKKQAEYDMGYMLIQGRGTTQNIDRGLEFLRKSADKNYQPSIDYCRLLKEIGVIKNEKGKTK